MIENMTNEQAAECLKTIHVLSFKDETATFFLTDVQNAFKLAIKALEQARPKGKWIATENEEINIVGYYCSSCDLPMETEEKTAFCPNCGADMRGESE